MLVELVGVAMMSYPLDLSLWLSLVAHRGTSHIGLAAVVAGIGYASLGEYLAGMGVDASSDAAVVVGRR